MIELSKKELLQVNGGGISFAMGCFLLGAVIFIIGVIDGYVRPVKCNG